MRTTWLLTVMLVGSLLSAPALGADPLPRDKACRSPRAAMRTLLDWVQPDRTVPAKAAWCLDARGLANPSKAPERAVQLKRVLDLKGLWVEFSDIPNDPEYVDEATEKARYVFFPALLPEVFVVKIGDEWKFSTETVAAAPALYRSMVSETTERLVDALPPWAQASWIGVAVWQVLALFLLLVLAWILRVVIVKLAVRALLKVLGRFGFDQVVEPVARAERSLGWLVFLGLLAWLFPALQFSVQVNRVAMVILRTGAVVASVFVAYRLAGMVAVLFELRARRTETDLDDQLVPLFSKTVKVLVVVIGGIFVLQNLDVDVGSLLAGLGLGGLAFALAAKDTAANLFGSITVFLDRPFKVGDWVVIGGVEGTVEEVGLRSTRVRTFANSLASVPNATVANTQIDNMGLRQFRRTSTTVSLTYDTTPEQMDAFCQGVRAVIAASPYTRKDYYEVHFVGFGDSGLEVLLYFFFDVSDWSDELRGRHLVYLDLLRLAQDLGISFAFPSRSVYFENEPGKPMPDRQRPDIDELKRVIEGYGPGGQRGRPQGPVLTHGYYAGKIAGTGLPVADEDDKPK